MNTKTLVKFLRALGGPTLAAVALSALPSLGVAEVNLVWTCPTAIIGSATGNCPSTAWSWQRGEIGRIVASGGVTEPLGWDMGTWRPWEDIGFNEYVYACTADIPVGQTDGCPSSGVYTDEGFFVKSSVAPPSSAAPLAANLVRALLVAPATAWSYYGSATTHTNGLAAWTALPPEMEALARTLGKGRAAGHVYVTNVFEYVRNNIETEFRFGLGKGGRGALIDQSGTAFDQAELMVKLLRSAGISASYRLGTITLTAQQFGQWSGLFTTLTESTQAVTVNAQAACQLLADGAIPGSCAPSTGTLTSITLGHIYVSATYQDSTGTTVARFFDPSFKPSTLSNGIDIPAAMGCGTASASTCGTGMTSAAMTGAISSTAALNGVTAPYVQNLNETQLNSWLQARATSLQAQIQNTNRIAALEQVVGGRQLTLSPTPAPAASLPYVTATQMTWTGDIPDQFRTKLRVRAGGDRTFFADELAGRRLQLTQRSQSLGGLELDGTILPPAPCSTCVAGVLLDVDHPYATAGYADESQTFTFFQFTANFVSWPQYGFLPATIVHGFGNASSSTERHYAALQEVLPKSHFVEYDMSNVPNPTRTELTYENKEQALIAIRALAQASVADRLIAGISRSVIIRHHTFGMAYTHSSNPAALNSLSMQPALSVVSATNDDTARRAAFETVSSTFATVEGSVNQQLNSTDDGLSAASQFWVANLPGSGGVRQRFFEMSNAQLQAAFGNTPAALAGYSSVFPEATGASILFAPNSLGHLAGEMKGGAAITSDPLGKAMDTIKVAELAAARKKYLSVSPADGAATITETDLVTGVDDFPHALPFRRIYASGTSVLDIYSPMGSYSYTTDSSEQAWRSDTYTLSYSGPDSAANSRIGGGWNHNYNVTASYSGNGPKALGDDYALEASASIAALRAVFDAARSPTLAGRVSSMLASRWLAKYQWAFNSVVVDKGGVTESFSRLPDGTFFTPSGAARLVQSGAQTALNDFSPVSFAYTGKHGDEIAFTVALFSKVPVCCNAQTKGEPVFKADTWRFADGTVVTFNYTAEYLITSGSQGVWPDVTCVSGSNCPPGAIHLPRGAVLRSVSNNLGRSLTFGLSNTEIQTFVQTPQGANPDMLSSRFTITSVTDESGRSVQYNWSGTCSGLWACNKLTVTGTDGRASVYDYAPGADSPNPTAVTRDAYRLRRWFTPSDSSNAFRVVAYDELFHVRTVRDPLGNLTYHFPGGVMGSERWKRAETVSALGAVNTQIFDDNNSLLKSIDPLGRTTTMTYDNANRVLTTTHHEGNSVAHAYDVRSNILSTVQRAKPNSGYADLTTSATYGEGAAVANCTNWRTCNKPLTETDARTGVTNYTYNATTGQLLTVLSPTVPLNGSNVQPLTTLCYGNHSGSSLLTGRIDKVNATTNRVRAYTYNGGVLQTATVDPSTTLTPPTSSSLTCPSSTKSGALNLTTTLSFDGVGNLQSVNGPRTDVTDLTTYTFDRARRITKIVAADTTTRYCYDADGLLRGTHRARVAGAPDPNAATAGTNGSCPDAYPPASWQSELRDYWATGDLRSVQDAELNIMRYAHDADGQLRVVQDPEGRQVATVYNLAGQVLATWRGGRTWLDGSGNLASGVPGETTPWDPLTYANAGNEGPLRYSIYTYTGNGKQKNVQDANNNTTEYIYDGHDRLFFTFFPHPTTGARCSVTPPITSTTAPTCTPSDNIAPTYETSTYDPSGNLLTFRSRKNQTIMRTYDNVNRVRTKAAPSSGLVTYDYNLVNEPMLVASPASGTIPAHSVAYDYDAAGRKLFEENRINPAVLVNPLRVSFEYDEAGNRRRTLWPDGYSVYYTYDALNRMEYARENAINGTELAFYDYDPLSRREQLRFAATSGNRIDYTYEPDSNLDLLTNVLNTVTVTLNHGHNRAGQLNSIVANDDFYLPTPPAPSSTVYAANRLNQYGSIGGQNATHDLNGNLLTWFRNGVRQTYTYDAENRLLTAATDGTTTPSATYDYDALGRRVSKTGSGTTPTYFLLDGDEEIAEYSDTGVLQRRYIMGPAIDDRIARAETNATSNPPKTYYHINHQGSVIATANPNGSIAQQLAYDEYGNLTSQAPAATTGEPFRYTGRRYDRETNLYYYRARYYSTELGRFLQVDPVGYKDDFNLYAYVRNDPLNATDPLGLNAWDDFTAGYTQGVATYTLGYEMLDAPLPDGVDSASAAFTMGRAFGYTSADFAASPAASPVPGPTKMLGVPLRQAAPARGELQSAANRVKASASHPLAAARRTIAVGQTVKGERVVAGSKGGLDAGMKKQAEAEGLTVVPSKGGNHAEENLIRARDNLTDIGTTQPPCGSNRHDCAGQMAERQIRDNNR